jgi:hypothetical protein
MKMVIIPHKILILSIYTLQNELHDMIVIAVDS